jgi:hypothetical protein
MNKRVGALVLGSVTLAAACTDAPEPVISPGQGRPLETRRAVQSRTPDGRNAGKFSLTFAWGAIHGAYDTDPAP